MLPISGPEVFTLLKGYSLGEFSYSLTQDGDLKNTYLVDAEKGSYFFEVFSNITPNDLATRVALSNYLGKKMGLGDQVVPTLNRTWFTSNDSGHFGLLYKQVPGVQKTVFNMDDLSAIGETLGLIHNVKIPNFPIKNYVSSFTGQGNEIRMYSNQPISEMLKEVEKVEQEEFFCSPDYTGLMIGSIDVENIFIDEDGKAVFGKLADSTMVGPLLVDQMNLFNKLKNLNPKLRPMEVFAALGAGYDRVRPSEWLDGEIFTKIRRYCHEADSYNKFVISASDEVGV